MNENRTNVISSASTDEGPTTAQMLDQLTRFDGAPEAFLAGLLVLQCRIGEAEAGTILRAGAEGGTDVLAVHPPLEQGAAAPVWLAQSVEFAPQAFSSAQTTVRPFHETTDLYGQPPKRHIVMIPIRTGFQGVAAFVVQSVGPSDIGARSERLEMTIGFLSLYQMRLALQSRQLDLDRLQAALSILPAINDRDRFVGAAMAFCNEAAAKWRCERGNLGFLKGRYVQLRAMSHTEKFSRKMKVVQDIEAAMEECLDQDTEVVYPAEADATYVNRATAELATRHGQTAVCSLPLRRAGKVAAVLTLERPVSQPFTLGEIEAMRLACDLSTARLVSLCEHDRWFGAKMGQALSRGLATVVGPKHTWKKLIAVLVAALAVFLVVAKGEYKAEAPFIIEATERQVVPAPFDGYLKDVFVAPGDDVEKGKTVLATLETAELELKLVAAKADMIAYLKQASTAMRDEKYAEAEIARAQAQKVAAQIDLIEYQKSQATIISTMTGKVVTGDLKRQIGAPVKTGDALFEVAPLGSMRAELAVPEDQITEVKEQQTGELATASYPGVRLEFNVERINPIAEVINQRNVFKVRARLKLDSGAVSAYRWLRPGMEGLAKVNLGRKHYAWIWTRRPVNWLRMKLWL